MQKKIFLSGLIILCVIAALWAAFKIKNKDAREEFTLWTIQLKPVAQDIIEENIKTFEDKHPDIKVVWVDIPIAEAQKRTLASILGGNPPDLVNLNPDFSVILAQKGALEYFSDEDAADFVPSVSNMLKYEGKFFALPYYVTSSITLYNKKIFNNCGFENPPKTYEELAQIAPKLKACSHIYPLAINLNENDSLAKILNKYGIYDFHSEDDVLGAIEVFSMFDDMYKENLISKDTLTINHREMVEKYMSQNALFVVIGSNFLNMVEQNAPAIYKNSDVSAQLTSDGGKFDAALMNLIIPKRAKHKDLAREFAAIMTNSASQVALAKLTNVIPVNKNALDDPYFKSCNANLSAKARCISVEQIQNLQDKDFGTRNKKAINDVINKSIETILLDKNINAEQIEQQIRAMSDKINYFMGS